jgi:hypothetical protein
MDDWNRSVELLLKKLYIAAEGAGLPKEERLKAKQVASLLAEIDRRRGACRAARPWCWSMRRPENPMSG